MSDVELSAVQEDIMLEEGMEEYYDKHMRDRE